MKVTKLVELVSFEFTYPDLDFDDDGNYNKLSSIIYPEVREYDDNLAIVFKDDTGEITNVFSFNNKEESNQHLLDTKSIHTLDLKAMYEDVFCRYKYGGMILKPR